MRKATFAPVRHYCIEDSALVFGIMEANYSREKGIEKYTAGDAEADGWATEAPRGRVCPMDQKGDQSSRRESTCMLGPVLVRDILAREMEMGINTCELFIRTVVQEVHRVERF